VRVGNGTHSPKIVFNNEILYSDCKFSSQSAPFQLLSTVRLPPNIVSLASLMTFHINLVFHYNFYLFPDLGRKKFSVFFFFKQILNWLQSSKLPLRASHAALTP
jgi:hypothetical protein